MSRLKLILLVALAAAAILAAFLLPVRELLVGFLSWVKGLGGWGPVLLAVAYVPAALLLVPGLVLTLGAGFLFGLGAGTLAVSAGSLMGASAAFSPGVRWPADGWSGRSRPIAGSPPSTGQSRRTASRSCC